MTQVVVRHAGLEDVEAMAALLEEMDRFYGASPADPVGERVRQITEALFGDPRAAYALLAWDGERPVGFAAYSFLWPAVGMTRSLYLKELYVAGDCQRQGIGRQLMQALFDVAGKHGCSRVEWTTDQDNRDAQEFYAALGSPTCPSKIFYRVGETNDGFQFAQ